MNENNIMKKYSLLLKKLKEKKKIAVAFSGGIDSSLVAYAAMQAEIEVILITLTSPLFSFHDEEMAKRFTQQFDLPHVFVPHSLDKHVSQNDIMRCYYCKSEEAKLWKETARKHGFTIVSDGANFDDLQDEKRPGVKACSELDIWHPLAEVQLTKKEIRDIAKKLGLPMWNRPSNACLASRIRYGEKITLAKLRRIEASEDFLRTISPQVRVRTHNGIARIEVPITAIRDMLGKRRGIVTYLKSLGFIYITLDLEGYRSGSMHEENTIGE